MLGSDGDAAKAAANDIDGMTKEVKEIAANYKKAGVTSAEWLKQTPMKRTPFADRWSYGFIVVTVCQRFTDFVLKE